MKHVLLQERPLLHPIEGVKPWVVVNFLVRMRDFHQQKATRFLGRQRYSTNTLRTHFMMATIFSLKTTGQKILNLFQLEDCIPVCHVCPQPLMPT